MKKIIAILAVLVLTGMNVWAQDNTQSIILNVLRNDCVFTNTTTNNTFECKLGATNPNLLLTWNVTGDVGYDIYYWFDNSDLWKDDANTPTNYITSTTTPAIPTTKLSAIKLNLAATTNPISYSESVSVGNNTGLVKQWTKNIVLHIFYE